MSKIEVHHHLYPPVFTEALASIGGDLSGWSVPDRTGEGDQELSRSVAYRTTTLSVTAPGMCIVECAPTQ